MNTNAHQAAAPGIGQEPNSLGFSKAPAQTRVVVAMSGGVDSSVVAALLKRQGYDVVGITLQLYDHGAAVKKAGSCCAGQDIHDARRVAEMLDIPHYVLDYESRFRQSVVEDFVETYLAGATPIPCVRCNQRVKFHDLLATARQLGADCLATGHYVRRHEGADGAELLAGADQGRDQSYFLFATTRDQLDFLRFPLGHLSKDETRALAAQSGLAVAAKPDSQDICFVPEGRYVDVIEKLRPGAAAPGDIVHVDGTVLGRHEGIIGFTVGQRRGLHIAAAEPLYVVKLDAVANRVIVGPRAALAIRTLRLGEVNWIGPAVPAEGLAVSARVRSTRPPVPARLWLTAQGARVAFDTPEEGVAPGQACVFYTGARMLGGGWIAETNPA
jgi:tRNA-specific 2-thiouridylase